MHTLSYRKNVELNILFQGTPLWRLLPVLVLKIWRSRKRLSLVRSGSAKLPFTSHSKVYSNRIVLFFSFCWKSKSFCISISSVRIWPSSRYNFEILSLNKGWLPPNNSNQWKVSWAGQLPRTRWIELFRCKDIHNPNPNSRQWWKRTKVQRHWTQQETSKSKGT